MRINSVNTLQSTQTTNIRKSNSPQFGSILKCDTKTLDNADKFICIVSGPSGVGKGTILSKFKKLFPNFFKESVSCATRSPRAGEINGVHYNFLTLDEFNKGVQNGEFIEHVEVYPGKCYGTRFADVKKAYQEAPQNVMMEIDVDGARKAKTELEKEGLPTLKVFIKPDNIERLRSRLINRGTETAETINARVGRANYEVNCADEYDVVIQNNDNVDENVNDLIKIFKKFL